MTKNTKLKCDFDYDGYCLTCEKKHTGKQGQTVKRKIERNKPEIIDLTPSWEFAVKVYTDFFRRHARADTPKKLLETNIKELMALAKSYDEIIKDCKRHGVTLKQTN